MSGRRGRGGRGILQTTTRAFLARSAQEAGYDRNLNQLTLYEITHPPLFPNFLWHSNGKYWIPPSPAPISPEEATAGTQSIAIQADPVPSLDIVASSSNITDIVTSAAIVNTGTTNIASHTRSTPTLAHPKRPASLINLINKHRELLQAFHASAQRLQIPSNDEAGFWDVPRWNDPPQGTSSLDVQVTNSLGKLGTDVRFFPPELLPSQDTILRPSQQSSRKRRRNTGVVTVGSSLNTIPSSKKTLRWKEWEESETITTSTTQITSTTADTPTTTPSSSSIRATNRMKTRSTSFDEDAPLEAPTSSAGTIIIAAAATADEHEDEVDEPLPPEDEEELEDYTMNYYESDNESEAEDGEATF